jgi:valyl-tRNA synthetase
MPFVTEELWQRLPHGGDALIVAPWPHVGADYPEEYEKFEAVKEATRLIRNARAEHGVDPARQIEAIVYPGGLAQAYEGAARELQFLARIDEGSFALRSGAPEAPEGPSVSIVSGGASIYLPLAGLVDLQAERERLERELHDARDEVGRAKAMLDNEQFTAKAPPNVVQQQRDRLERATEQVELLEHRLAELGPAT